MTETLQAKEIRIQGLFVQYALNEAEMALLITFEAETGFSLSNSSISDASLVRTRYDFRNYYSENTGNFKCWAEVADGNININFRELLGGTYGLPGDDELAEDINTTEMPVYPEEDKNETTNEADIKQSTVLAPEEPKKRKTRTKKSDNAATEDVAN